MRREHDTTQQLKQIDNEIAEHYQGVPPASWTKVDMPLYQCSRLNPEIEMTSFQLENITCPSPQQQQQYKSIKRKASEDRFDSFPTPLGLKRRAVSPSLSLNGSPVLTGYNSPPTTGLAFFGNVGNNTGSSNSSVQSAGSSSGTSLNAAARAQQKGSTFNLHEASGGLSRMSLSE
ncbi:hypothetical protein BDF20DRAFT_849506 [Mycotypha africana]|uniref:uncharacterized protein n=1 Tax=Mycotypha africana TaxID=64632 RepID=UPI002301F662|nr:uncharacterized protein BDF20DRAFT_849506 [Mycotypha africana]KAI8987329.1 hypothetical protein BDF20DRAFT_849506 [Mycotypha africana]